MPLLATLALAIAANVSVAEGSLARQILNAVAASSNFNGAMLLESRGHVVLRAGFGRADRERRIPFTTETIAPIGSITKQFTASAILMLERRDLLSLKQPLRAYLPNAAEPAGSLRLSELLNHTSGIAEYCPGGDFVRVSTSDLLAKCAALPLQYARGTWHYSNLGYSLLGAVVEAVTHEPLERVLHDSYFLPYGMAKTGSSYTDYELEHWPFAKAYDEHGAQNNEAIRIAPLRGEYWNLKGNGDIQSTAEDMLRWYHALRFAPELQYIRTGLARPTARNALGTYYADGWFIRLDSRMKPYNIFHSGSDGSLLAYFGWWPKQDIFFYYVTNFGSAKSVITLKKILSYLPSG